MKRTFFLIALATAAILRAQGPDIVGDWRGTLIVGPDKIHLTLHIATGDKGTLKATMDSAEQGVKGVPVTTIALQADRIALTIDSVHASYNGTVKSAIGAIEGTWSQGQPMPLTFTRPPKSTGTVKPSELDGTWLGVLQVGGYSLHLAFHITTTPNGLAATMDSPDQNAFGLRVIDARRDVDTLVLQMPDMEAKYNGEIAKDLSSIEGFFTQGGASLPLTLKRNADSK